jgi:hypothetical protein
MPQLYSAPSSGVPAGAQLDFAQELSLDATESDCCTSRQLMSYMRCRAAIVAVCRITRQNMHVLHVVAAVCAAKTAYPTVLAMHQ